MKKENIEQLIRKMGNNKTGPLNGQHKFLKIYSHKQMATSMEQQSPFIDCQDVFCAYFWQWKEGPALKAIVN